MLRRLPIAIAASLLLAGVASAQPGPPPGPRPSGPPPGDHERGGPPGRLFLSPSGEPFRTENGLSDWFAAADADHDGALTLAEFRADAMRFFKVLDLDGDGWIDGPENSNYERKIAPEITQMSFGGPGGGPRGEGGKRKPFISKTSKRQEPRQGAARFSLLNEAQPVRGADFDLNQRVSAEEWAKMAGRRFALLDTQATGKLTIHDLTPRLP